MTNVTIFTKTGCVEVPGVEVGHVLVHQPYFIEPRDNYWVKIDPKAKTCKHMRKVRLRYHTNSLAERPTHRVIGYPPNHWVFSHKYTGLGFMKVKGTERAAIRLAESIGSRFDLSFEKSEDVPANFKEWCLVGSIEEQLPVTRLPLRDDFPWAYELIPKAEVDELYSPSVAWVHGREP